MCSIIYSADSALENKRKLQKKMAGFLIACLLVFTGFVYNIAFASNAPATQTQTTQPTDLSLLQAIPSEPIAAYASFGTGGMDANTGQVVTTLITTAGMTGLFNANQQILADVVASLVAVGKYPYSVFLLDCGCKKLGEGSFTLKNLSLGLVILAPPQDHGKFLTLLKQTIDHYFTADDAKLTWVGEGTSRHQKLESPKFPDWCCWEWGSVGETFIFTIGPNAFDTVAQTTPKNAFVQDPLIRLARKHDADIHERFIMTYLNVTSLSRKLRPIMQKSFDDILRSFAAADMDQFLYSAGFTNRAYISKTYTKRDSNDVELGILTGDFNPNDPRARAVPPGATAYGVGYTNISKAVQYGVDTYLASRNPRYQEKLTRNYNALAEQAELGNVHDILLSHFGPAAMVIVHDWPKHPFNLPIARTILVQHDASPDFKNTWNKVLSTWQMMLKSMSDSGKNDKTASAWETLFDLQIDRTQNDIWFLHIGPIVLVAAGMDDNFLVLSYSIPAVQANLNHLNSSFKTTTKPNK